MAQGRGDKQHLVARLVRACEEVQQNGKTSTADGEKLSKEITLTEEEILSNLFIYAFAGNDTTAIALTNILVHLAANPKTQDWITEEINFYLPTSDPEFWNYEAFPKLKRCAAVVSSDVPSSISTRETTNSTPQPLKINGTMYMVPANTSVHCSLPALYTHSRYWGPDPMAWNPRHFISVSDSEPTPIGTHRRLLETEVLAADTSEHFMPWAWGQRVCPGKRFFRVELVAVLAVLFREWRVEPELNGKGETLEQARERAWRSSLVVDSEGHMLHEMLNPERVGLRWSRRESV